MNILVNPGGRVSHAAKKTVMTLAGGLIVACSAHEGGVGDGTPAGSVNDGPPSAVTEGSSSAATQLPEAPSRTYTIDLGGDHKISYSIFEDGGAIVAESGRLGIDEPVGSSIGGYGPEAAFRKLRPDVAIPKELAEIEPLFAPKIAGEEPEETAATEVADPAKPLQLLPDQVAPPATGLVPKDITSDPNSFLSIFGCFAGPTDVVNLCLTNRGEWALTQAVSTRWAIFKVGSYLGDFNVLVYRGGILTRNFPLGQGGFLWIYSRGNLKTHYRNTGTFSGAQKKTYPDAITHQFQIIDAAGDQFHMHIRQHNFQTSGAGCAERWSTDVSSWIGAGDQETDCPSHYGP